MNAVAETILAQLGGSRRLSLMIGAHSFDAGPSSLCFRFKARAKNRIKAIRVTLDPSDTYTVEFISIHGVDIKKDPIENVYADSLRTLIESKTGLALSL